MKVFIFSGREHHTQKMLPLYHALGATFLIANNAINIDPSLLHVTGMRHVHLYNYLNNEFKRPEIELPISVFMSIPPFWSEFSRLEFEEVYAATENFITAESPELIIGLHENNFWFKTIAYLCRKHGVKCVVLQEGLIRDADQELYGKQSLAAEYADKILVWGKSARESYIKAGIDPRIIAVTGPVHMDGISKKNPDGNVVIAFTPPRLDQYVGNFRDDLSFIARICTENGWRLVVKFHPFDKIALSGVGIWDGDASSLLSSCDLVICQHSTIGLEALALGIPIVEINNTSNRITQSWAEAGVAPVLKNSSDIESLLKAGIPKKAAKFASGHMLCDGKAMDRTIKYLRELFL